MATGIFEIVGIESGSFDNIVTKQIEVNYTGQSITYNGLKTVAANEYGLTYNDQDIDGTESNIPKLDSYILYGIEEKTIANKTFNYIVIKKDVKITLD